MKIRKLQTEEFRQEPTVSLHDETEEEQPEVVQDPTLAYPGGIQEL